MRVVQYAQVYYILSISENSKNQYNEQNLILMGLFMLFIIIITCHKEESLELKYNWLK